MILLVHLGPGPRMRGTDGGRRGRRPVGEETGRGACLSTAMLQPLQLLSHVPSCDPRTRRRPSPRGGDAVEEAREDEEEDQPMTTEAEVGLWG